MSRRGRSASLPPADHSAPAVLDPVDDRVVHHRDRDGHVREFDFATLPVAEPMQRSLATLFGAVTEGWSSHGTSKGAFKNIRAFTKYLSECVKPPQDLEGLTAALVNGWWLQQKDRQGSRAAFRQVRSLLIEDARLQQGPVAEALTRRVPLLPRDQESYESAELGQIKLTALRIFRSARLRIEENTAHLHQWHEGAFSPDSPDGLLGEALDIIARTADVPRYSRGDVQQRYRRALGGNDAETLWKRLFLDRMEAVSLGVLLMAEFGWNLSVINVMPTPTAAPDFGGDGHPTYNIKVWKHKGKRFESENVADTGAGSPGRLITEALGATRFARALANDLAPGIDRFVGWRPLQRRETTDKSRRVIVGPIRFGLDGNDAAVWGKKTGTGSPFQRGRRTVVVERGEPSQHSLDTHERRYVLPDKRVQREAAPIVAAGAAAAVRTARRQVQLRARLVDQRSAEHGETATADCSGTEGGPAPLPNGGCGASFLLCLACENARVHADHHPRLVLLHQALVNARTVLPAPAWERRWGDAHARLDDLQRKVGPGAWQQARTRITDLDRTIVDNLLNGYLNP
ncbi:hypothetical protein [Streptomyces sp. NPDC019937]|uniref:hypothetical protein n=1 Tax=Streptomyces sp. NPDC019937 TaxID=3154787 RepID=UPI0034034FCF